MQQEKIEEAQKEIMRSLEEVIDPELGVSIVKLGLILGVEISEYNEDFDMFEKIKIIMTLTTPLCPFADALVQDVEDTVNILGKGEAEVELNFDKAWEPSEEMRLEMGL